MDTDYKNVVLKDFDLTEKSVANFGTIDRREAIEAFGKLGFPNLKNEEWKYTNLKKIIESNPEFSRLESNTKVSKEVLNKFLIAGKDATLLVFENGIFKSALSSPVSAADGYTISNLAAINKDETVMNYLGKIAPSHSEPFVALNNAFLSDGALLHIKAGQNISKPIHLIFINSSNNPKHTISVRNLIVAEKGCCVNITESYHSLDDSNCGFTNSVTEVVVQENANVELVKVQLESASSNHVSFTQAVQARDSIFDTVTVTLGGALVRNNLHIKMNDLNCTAHLFGLYILDGEQLIDNHTLVDHAKPNCFSNELYKGIIGGIGTGVFNGKIMVRKDAQKTNAYQSNKNILLTDDAQMNTKPQLEIFADDVKCTHGATTGQIDEDALFYLRARGIGEQNARTLLNIAFAGDVLNNIKNETLKENLLQLAIDKLDTNG